MNMGIENVCSAIRRSVGGLVVLGLCIGGVAASSSFQKGDLPDVSGIPAASPVPYSSKSVAAGKATFQRLCAECHDEDGKALAQMMGPAADLTDPSRWKYGTSDQHVFRSIRDGAGSAMPVFGKQLSEPQMWELVHFIRSIGPASAKPAQQP
jgi:cytochrome c oxidase cbb3-type subunit III